MALENILSQEIVQKLGWTLLHFIWQAAAVALLLGILLAVLRKSSANVRYIAACTALGLIVLLPIVTLQLVPISVPQPVANIEPPPAPVITPAQPTIEETSPVVVVEHEQPAKLESNVVMPNISWKQRAVERLEPALPYLVAGWLLGVFGLSLWHLGGWARLQRLKKQMVKRVDNSLQTKMNELAARLRVNRVIELVESALVQVPTVIGWLRPVILLPTSALTGLTAEQLEALLAHELAHIRRYDYLANMLQTVVETLGFYHPAVWWISHRIRIERENCCDDLAVSISGDRIRYAKALTSMEEIRASRSGLAVAATGGSLFSRIRRLVCKDSNESSKTSWIPSVITILMIAIIAIPTTLALTDKSDKPDDLLNFILIQNEKARKKFTTVSYTFELQSEATFNLQGENLPARVVQGPRSLQKRISGEEFKKGKWRYSSMEQQDKSAYLQSGRTEEQNRLERAVFNDDYAASWHVGSIYAYQFDHESLSTMSDRSHAHFALQSIDPIEYGFGDEEYTMMGLYRLMKDKTPFKAEKSVSNGRSVYQIKQFSSWMLDPNHPSCVYVIDPERGFLITSFTAHHQDGSISDEYVVEAEKAQGSDIWLPVRIQEKAYRRKSDTTEYLPQLRKTVRITLNDIKVNEPIEDEKFTLMALQLTDKVCLIKETLDGKTVLMLKKDGVWVPSEAISRAEETAKHLNIETKNVEWENIGGIIPPDFNDTKVLIEHINIGSIGQDCE
jgi:beta-lactamase regulating signal transducer with metallopeptidase domain